VFGIGQVRENSRRHRSGSAAGSHGLQEIAEGIADCDGPTILARWRSASKIRAGQGLSCCPPRQRCFSSGGPPCLLLCPVSSRFPGAGPVVSARRQCTPHLPRRFRPDHRPRLGRSEPQPSPQAPGRDGAAPARDPPAARRDPHQGFPDAADRGSEATPLSADCATGDPGASGRTIMVPRPDRPNIPRHSPHRRLLDGTPRRGRATRSRPSARAGRPSFPTSSAIS